MAEGVGFEPTDILICDFKNHWLGQEFKPGEKILGPPGANLVPRFLMSKVLIWTIIQISYWRKCMGIEPTDLPVCGFQGRRIDQEFKATELLFRWVGRLVNWNNLRITDWCLEVWGHTATWKDGLSGKEPTK